MVVISLISLFYNHIYLNIPKWDAQMTKSNEKCIAMGGKPITVKGGHWFCTIDVKGKE